MMAPEPLIISSKRLQNVLFRVQHPQNMVWGPTCGHSGPKNTVLGQKMAFFGQKCVFLVMAVICSKTFQNTFL